MNKKHTKRRYPDLKTDEMEVGKRRRPTPDHISRYFGELLRHGRIETSIYRDKRRNEIPNLNSPLRTRFTGEGGADYDASEHHPLDYYLRALEAKYSADIEMLRREVELPIRRAKALDANAQKAAASRKAVLALASDPTHIRNGKPNRSKIVATLAKAGNGIGYSQVCRILAAAKKYSHD